MQTITKEELVEAVKTNKCANLDRLPVGSMSKIELVKHLKTVDCPCLKKLVETKKLKSK